MIILCSLSWFIETCVPLVWSTSNLLGLTSTVRKCPFDMHGSLHNRHHLHQDTSVNLQASQLGLNMLLSSMFMYKKVNSEHFLLVI